MRIEAKNLEQALMKAARELECSVVDIEYEVVQYHKSGFLGLFQKSAIIEARSKRKHNKKYQKKPYDKPRYNDNSRYNAREFNESKPNYERKYERKDYDRERAEFGGKNYERRDYENKGYDKPYERKEFNDKFSDKSFESKASENKFASNPYESNFFEPRSSNSQNERNFAPNFDAPSSPRSANFDSTNSSASSRPANLNSTNAYAPNAQSSSYSPNADEKQSAPTQRAQTPQNVDTKSAEPVKNADSAKTAGVEKAQTPSAPNLSPLSKSKYVVRDDAIFSSFHKESGVNPKIYIDEIRIQLDKLLKAGEFDIRIMELSVYDKNSIYIRLDGNDAALLIGKEAYRYKALSYLLHNWINAKYNLLIRLEIADFLRNQAQGMDFYLKTIIEKVESTGRAQTKPLDGVLVKIALEKLRERFPNKYVGIRQNGEQKFIIINDFLKKDE